MPIITISRGSYSQGRKVAERVAEKLGYTCLARKVILDASELFHVPEGELCDAIEHPPSFFERLSHGKDGYIAYVRAALLKHFQDDNIVYHGLHGHYFLPDVSHLVNVRVIADHVCRTSVVMERDKVSEQEARKILKKSDHERRQWAMHLYGMDPVTPELYDLIVHVGRMTPDDAADIICECARLTTFQATPESQALVVDMALAAEVTALLYEHMPGVEVKTKDGETMVTVPAARVLSGFSDEAAAAYREDIDRQVRELTLHMDTIKSLEIQIRARN